MSSYNPVELIENAEEACLARHKKERKDLQAEIQKLKNSVSKGDKKKKKEVTTQIALLEQQLTMRHDEELKALRQDLENKKVRDDLSDLKITDQSETFPENCQEMSGQQGTRISKSQKRKTKKAQREAEANERIRQGEIDGMFSDRRVEEEKFQKILKGRELKMHQVPSDGDCLYASFVHQLSLQGIKSSVADLRRETANYLRRNVDEFIPFLVNEETGDLYTEAEYLEYCSRVESSPEWGGQAELKALSEVLGADIEVIQAEGPSIHIGDQSGEAKKVIVTYHRHAYGLGEHYNSVEPRTHEDDQGDEFE